LKPQYDEALSSVGFELNLRCYNLGAMSSTVQWQRGHWGVGGLQAGAYNLSHISST
jgi:hypothetical protein